MDGYRNSQETQYYDDEYREKSKYGVGVGFLSMTGVIILLVLCSLFSCCKSVEYVKVPEYHYETITKTDTFVSKDSVYCSDSVYIIKEGDTTVIYKTKYLYKDRWRDRVKIDSVVKVDSIRVPYPVEKKLTKWQKLKQDAGGIAIGISIAGIIIILCLLFIYRRK